MSTSAFETIALSEPAYESGGVRHATVYSRALGHRADCTFWAPMRGGDPLDLVILLHGVYASHWAWTGIGGAHVVAATVAAQRDCRPFALAMPSDGLYGHGSGYVATQAGAVERWIVDEVPQLAAIAVPGVDADALVSIVGLSMGGFGALSLGAWNADRIATVVGMSSITHFDQMELFVGSLDGYSIEPDRRSVIESVVHNRRRLPAIHIDCGSEDPLIRANRELHTALSAEGISHTWEEHTGGHDWVYWHAHLFEALRFCSTRGE